MRAIATIAALSLSLASIASLTACSPSVGGAVAPTGPVVAAYTGPVAIYPSGHMPPGATDLGVIEVHALQEDANVETLLPQFVQRVAAIGGNVAVVDGIRARFQVVGRTHVETFYYTCGMGGTCAGTRVYSANDEIMIVSMIGHAATTTPGASAPLLPRGGDASQPIRPDEPETGPPSTPPPEPSAPPPSPSPSTEPTSPAAPAPTEPLPSEPPHPLPRGPEEPM